MTGLNLATLTDKDPLVQKFKKALESATGQSIPIINMLKVKRVSGVSIRPVELVLAGGQQITLLIRQAGDVYRVLINGKDLPMAGDLGVHYEASFKAGISEIADAIRNGQKAFEKKQSRQKVVIPASGRTTPKNTSQLLKQALEEIQQNDEIIKQKTEARDALLAQLEQKKQQMPV